MVVRTLESNRKARAKIEPKRILIISIYMYGIKHTY
jgi:hypothetical protein